MRHSRAARGGGRRGGKGGVEEDKRKGFFTTSDLAPRQVPALQQAMSAGPRFGSRAKASGWLGGGHPLA